MLATVIVLAVLGFFIIFMILMSLMLLDLGFGMSLSDIWNKARFPRHRVKRLIKANMPVIVAEARSRYNPDVYPAKYEAKLRELIRDYAENPRLLLQKQHNIVEEMMRYDPYAMQREIKRLENELKNNG